jgi:hypothetical protein
MTFICVYAVQVMSEVPALSPPKFTDPNIEIDGHLNETVWQSVPALDEMTVIRPDLLTIPRYKTRTQLHYTDKGLYVGITAEQPPETLLARLSSRDKTINRDGVTIYLDTSGEGRYGFFFGVNLGGSLVDGTILPERQVSYLWDGAWYGQSVATDDGYTSEMFLPWSMLAMPEGLDVRHMGYFVMRRVAHLDEEWGWPALPVTGPTFLSRFVPLEFERISTTKQFAFYPFSAASYNKMHSEKDSRIGTDIFWKPSSGLQLLATLNPDFGTVESDDVVVNLTSFETFFPEKRLFFLEANEMFITSPRSARSSGSGGTGARPTANTFFLEPTTLLNTRRIGGPAPPPTIPQGVTVADVELGRPTELKGALKLVGETGSFRYGVLAAAEDDTVFRGTDAAGHAVPVKQTGRDFGVVRWLYENTDNGRRGIGWMSTLTSHPAVDAKTHGLDLHYRNANGKVRADTQFMRSDVDSVTGNGVFTDVYYFPRRGRMHKFTLDYFDENLDVSDLGFIRRNDEITMRYTHNRISSGFEHLREVTNTLSVSYVTNTDRLVTRPSVWYKNTRTFPDKSKLELTGMVTGPRWDDRTNRGHGNFKFDEGFVAEVAYGTDTARVLSASIGFNTMTEQLGQLSHNVKAGFTYKPNDRISVDLDISYRRADHWMIYLDEDVLGAYEAAHWQPKLGMEVFLSARQQLRLSMQWVGIQARAQDLYGVSEQEDELQRLTDGISDDTFDFTISRMTAQLRYRWEIAPLSDLFVVYTRGSNIPNRVDDGFGDLFHDALTDPIIDLFVVKLRYRFGN